MIQTLVLANSVHRPHPQISMRILSLSLFHKFVEIRACGLQRTPDVVFWLKLVSVPCFKNIVWKTASQQYVVGKRKRAFVACRHRSERFGLDIHSNFSQTLQLSTLQLNQLFNNAIHFTMNLQLWHLKTVSHPFKRFDVIVRRDISIHLGEM